MMFHSIVVSALLASAAAKPFDLRNSLKEEDVGPFKRALKTAFKQSSKELIAQSKKEHSSGIGLFAHNLYEKGTDPTAPGLVQLSEHMLSKLGLDGLDGSKHRKLKGSGSSNKGSGSGSGSSKLFGLAVEVDDDDSYFSVLNGGFVTALSDDDMVATCNAVPDMVANPISATDDESLIMWWGSDLPNACAGDYRGIIQGEVTDDGCETTIVSFTGDSGGDDFDFVCYGPNVPSATVLACEEFDGGSCTPSLTAPSTNDENYNVDLGAEGGVAVFEIKCCPIYTISPGSGKGRRHIRG